MRTPLEHSAVAILATHGVDEAEMAAACATLEAAGARVDLVAPEPGRVQACRQLEPADTLAVQRTTSAADASDYAGLVLPGGAVSADALRLDREAVRLVRSFFAAAKPVGAIGHGPWLLVEADAVRHRSLTSWPSLRTDITNADGRWVDEEVCVDRGLVTSRRPADLPAFCTRLVDELAAAGRGVPPMPRAADTHVIPHGDVDAAVEAADVDSFPASDAPSSYHTT
jgi:protease I